MGWQENAIMYWSTVDPAVAVAGDWNRITDHNRDPLGVTVERIERAGRTVGGTMRRYHVANKRSFALSWSSLPSKNGSVHNGRTGIGTVDGGWAGEDIENFHNNNHGAFWMKLRKGTDDSKAITDGTLEVVRVMITDFAKDIEKRGIIDFWSLNMTLEEV